MSAAFPRDLASSLGASSSSQPRDAQTAFKMCLQQFDSTKVILFGPIRLQLLANSKPFCLGVLHNHAGAQAKSTNPRPPRNN
jgi:hypothetical protein